MKFIDNETGREVDFTPYDDEKQNVLTLFMSNKVVIHDGKHYAVRRDQTVFEVVDGQVYIEIEEIDIEEIL